jgi:hypothetical protein
MVASAIFEEILKMRMYSFDSCSLMILMRCSTEGSDCNMLLSLASSSSLSMSYMLAICRFLFEAIRNIAILRNSSAVCA